MVAKNSALKTTSPMRGGSTRTTILASGLRLKGSKFIEYVPLLLLRKISVTASARYKVRDTYHTSDTLYGFQSSAVLWTERCFTVLLAGLHLRIVYVILYFMIDRECTLNELTRSRALFGDSRNIT